MISNEKIIHAHDCHCIAWKPIIAGSLVAIGLSFLLNLFSVAVGLTAFTTSSEGVENLAFGGLIATGIGIVASMFAAGWITGYLSQNRCSKRHLGALYGFLVWCLALIIAVFVTSHVQQYVSFYGHFLSGTTEAAVQVTQAASSTAKVAVVGNKVAAENVVISAYIIFCLFFLSAFSSSLGGHCGMRHYCKKAGE